MGSNNEQDDSSAGVCCWLFLFKCRWPGPWMAWLMRSWKLWEPPGQSDRQEGKQVEAVWCHFSIEGAKTEESCSLSSNPTNASHYGNSVSSLLFPMCLPGLQKVESTFLWPWCSKGSGCELGAPIRWVSTTPRKRGFSSAAAVSPSECKHSHVAPCCSIFRVFLRLHL